MLTSMFTGVNGINASMSYLSVVGNNIANMNTIGFKGARSHFADILNQNLSGVSSTNNIGLGVSVESVETNFTQGAFETTENALDLAIDGSGFFCLLDGENQSYYTRAGMFKLNEDGYIVDHNKMYLQGRASSIGRCAASVSPRMNSTSPNWPTPSDTTPPTKCITESASVI